MQAVEYYEAQSNPRYKYFKYKLQELMENPRVNETLNKVAKNSSKRNSGVNPIGLNNDSTKNTGLNPIGPTNTDAGKLLNVSMSKCNQDSVLQRQNTGNMDKDAQKEILKERNERHKKQ